MKSHTCRNFLTIATDKLSLYKHREYICEIFHMKITIKEIKLLSIVLLFYIGFWFVNSSLKEWVVNNWDLTPLHTLGIGLGILMIGLFLVKYRTIWKI